MSKQNLGQNDEEPSFWKSLGAGIIGLVAAPFVAVGTFLGTLGLGTASGFVNGFDAVTKRVGGIPGIILGGIAGVGVAVAAAVVSAAGGAVLAAYFGIASPALAFEAGQKNESFKDILKSTWKWAGAVFKIIVSSIHSSIRESANDALNRPKQRTMMPTPLERPLSGRSSSSLERQGELNLEERYRNVSDSEVGKPIHFRGDLKPTTEPNILSEQYRKKTTKKTTKGGMKPTKDKGPKDEGQGPPRNIW